MCEVLHLLPPSQLHRFIANALRDEPTLAPHVVATAGNERLDVHRAIGYVHGLRLADFYHMAKAWHAIAEDHGVPACTQPLVFMFATADLAFSDPFPRELESARQAMAATTGTSYRDDLVGRLCLGRLAKLLAGTGDTHVAAQLLSILHGHGEALAVEAEPLLSQQAPLVHALKTCAIDELGECLAAARRCGTEMAQLMEDRIGGEAETVQRLRGQDPWITELEVRQVDGDVVVNARLLHVSDELQGDPSERAMTLSRLLLRCLPRIHRVDVKTLLAGGQELTVGDFNHGVSGLQRRYDRPALDTSLNQARMRAAHTILGQSDTERLAAALPLLDEAADLMQVFGTGLVTATDGGVDRHELTQRIAQLHTRARALRPSLGTVELGDTSLAEEHSLPMRDDLSALVTDLTGNVYPRLSNSDGYRGLPTYLSDTVIAKHLQGAYREPWHVIGIDSHPAPLDKLAQVLSDLHSVIDELSRDDADRGKIARTARSGARSSALARAAEVCRRTSRHRTQRRRHQLKAACQATGFRIEVLTPNPQQGTDAEDDTAVTVELPSLLEWAQALTALEAALADRKPGETFRIIPLRDGRPVPSLVVRMITNTWPSPDLGPWEQVLGAPHPTRLTDAFERAHTALQMLSAISTLQQAQQEHEDVESVAEVAAFQYRSALDEIMSIRRDPVIDELLVILDGHAERVQAELEGAVSRATVAEDVVTGALQGADTDAFNAVLGARIFALEWDIDSPRAVQLLMTMDPEDS